MSGIAYSPAKEAVAFFCFETGDVGFASAKGVEYVTRRLEVPSPMGMCCDSQGIVLFQLSPSLLWKFNQSLGCGASVCGRKAYFDLVANVVPGGRRSLVPAGMCRVGKDTIAIAFPYSHRIAVIGPAMSGVLMGCGRKGFSMSSNLASCSLHSPSGVCFDDQKGVLFVSDTGNGVLRRLTSLVEDIPVGIPGELKAVDGSISEARFESPAIIRMDGKRVVVVDAGNVRVVDFEAGSVSTVYIPRRKVIDVACGGGSIFALEEE